MKYSLLPQSDSQIDLCSLSTCMVIVRVDHASTHMHILNGTLNHYLVGVFELSETDHSWSPRIRTFVF